MEKIFEMFNQVKINVPLLDAIQQVPSYAKFLKDICTKKRKTNVSKKVFLATNINELLSGPIPVKLRTQVILLLLAQQDRLKSIEHFLIWEQVSTCSPSQYTSKSGWASLVRPKLSSNWLTGQ